MHETRRRTVLLWILEQFFHWTYVTEIHLFIKKWSFGFDFPMDVYRGIREFDVGRWWVSFMDVTNLLQMQLDFLPTRSVSEVRTEQGKLLVALSWAGQDRRGPQTRIWKRIQQAFTHMPFSAGKSKSQGTTSCRKSHFLPFTCPQKYLDGVTFISVNLNETISSLRQFTRRVFSALSRLAQNGVSRKKKKKRRWQNIYPCRLGRCLPSCRWYTTLVLCAHFAFGKLLWRRGHLRSLCSATEP